MLSVLADETPVLLSFMQHHLRSGFWSELGAPFHGGAAADMSCPVVRAGAAAAHPAVTIVQHALEMVRGLSSGGGDGRSQRTLLPRAPPAPTRAPARTLRGHTEQVSPPPAVLSDLYDGHI